MSNKNKNESTPLEGTATVDQETSTKKPSSSRKVGAKKNQMEEIPMNQILKQTADALKTSDRLADYKKEILGFLGSAKNDVKVYLEELIKSRLIKSYRLVSIGEPVTMELDPGRVTVVVDLTGKVIDIELP